MVFQVTWSPAALRDVDAIGEFIARDSPHFADTVVDQIFALAEDLAQFPRSGKTVPEIGSADLREKQIYSYRLIYRLGVGDILIVAIVHARRGSRTVLKRVK